MNVKGWIMFGTSIFTYVAPSTINLTVLIQTQQLSSTSYMNCRYPFQKVCPQTPIGPLGEGLNLQIIYPTMFNRLDSLLSIHSSEPYYELIPSP